MTTKLENQNRPLPRRTLFKQASVLSAGAYVSLRSPLSLASEQPATPANPHFFLQVFVPGGADSSYLFDARPLDMTKAKLLTNYIGKEPALYTGANGQTCLRTELTEPLMTHSDAFSVINGVMMSASFDGHEENESYFLAGQPLGGPLLFDDMSATHPAMINAVRLGAPLGSDGRNTCDGMLKLTASVGYVLVNAIKKSGNKALEATFVERFRRRLRDSATGIDSRSSSKLKLREALQYAPSVQERLSAMNFPAPNLGGGDPGAAATPAQDVATILNLFKAGMTNSGMYVFQSQNLDVHDASRAKRLPGELKTIMEQIAEIFQLLKSTPFDDQRTMLDVTTIVVGSEFGRTMRQSQDVENSGTDHNPLTNSVLIGGKGIKGGLVIGASDFETVDAFNTGVSGAHVSMDPSKMKIMGKPFDFATGTSRKDLPEKFELKDYLTIGSVINTVFDITGVPQERWRKERSGAPVFPILNTLRR